MGGEAERVDRSPHPDHVVGTVGGKMLYAIGQQFPATHVNVHNMSVTFAGPVSLMKLAAIAIEVTDAARLERQAASHLEGPNARARKIVADHVATFGAIPRDHWLVSAIADDLAFIELASIPHRDERSELIAALKGVIAVADRKTDEFDAARAVVAKAEGR